MREGDVDYSRYTLLELEEALVGINRDLYPKNFANLRVAFERLSTASAETSLQGSAIAVEREPLQGRQWRKFWDSRPVAVFGGVICVWWALDLMAGPDACHPGRKLIGRLINAACENLGHTAAAGILLVLGLIIAAYAVIPRRRADA
jgi:hypothetical protein